MVLSRWPHPAGLVVALALAALPRPADGRAQERPSAEATIVGRVEVRRARPPVAARPGVSQVGPSSPRPAGPPKPAVVFLESAPRGAFEREDGRARMDQRDETFVPYVLAITVGTTVDFPNSDPVFHNVFSLSRTRPFDLGRYPAGRSKSVRFDRPGVVQVFCEIHSHMAAYILVFAHRYFAVTAPDGSYRIDGVPPGSYTLSAWYEGSTRESRAITVGPGVTAQGAEFVIR